MLEDMELYNSIVREFQLSDSNLKQNKEAVETLTKARMDICKLLKVTEFNAETLGASEKQFITSIDINKTNIKIHEKKQIDLKEKIKIHKQEIKVIKLHLNKLEHNFQQEQLESRKFREALSIFLTREKFKFIKKLLLRRYRKVFLKYSNELNIKTKIVECNKRKEKIREEKQNFNNSIGSYNKKIIMDKKNISEIRKNIINMQKSIEFLSIKLQNLEEYKEMEKKFRLKVEQFKKM